MLKISCPECPEHKFFITIAHVAQDWLVNVHGDFMATWDTTETVAPPRKGNSWTCATCGADANVEED
jgi:hypothetical protein